MGFRIQSVVLLLAATSLPTLYAQQNATGGSVRLNEEAPQIQSSSPARLLSLDEGLAVIGAAMEMAHHRHAREDCSHFVHEIYDHAGFPYSYENSISLYDGTADFQRVTRPQPGDLIVWRGHIGIVVNPVQRSFFSLLRTGYGVENYDSRYWRRRGHPRFYRYIKTATPALTLASARTRSESPDEAPAEESANDIRQPTPPLVIAPLPSNDPPEAADPVIAFAQRPTAQVVSQAVESKLSEVNTRLADRDLLNSPKPVVIVEHIQVKKVRLKRDQGWVEVHLNERSSLAGGQADLQRRTEKQRWPLYRNGTQWQLELPTNAIYLPKETAVRLLAHQLASITGKSTPAPGGGPQEAQLARLLDHLLGE